MEQLSRFELWWRKLDKLRSRKFDERVELTFEWVCSHFLLKGWFLSVLVMILDCFNIWALFTQFCIHCKISSAALTMNEKKSNLCQQKKATVTNDFDQNTQFQVQTEKTTQQQTQIISYYKTSKPMYFLHEWICKGHRL